MIRQSITDYCSICFKDPSSSLEITANRTELYVAHQVRRQVSGVDHRGNRMSIPKGREQGLGWWLNRDRSYLTISNYRVESWALRRQEDRDGLLAVDKGFGFCWNLTCALDHLEPSALLLEMGPAYDNRLFQFLFPVVWAISGQSTQPCLPAPLAHWSLFSLREGFLLFKVLSSWLSASHSQALKLMLERNEKDKTRANSRQACSHRTCHDRWEHLPPPGSDIKGLCQNLLATLPAISPSSSVSVSSSLTPSYCASVRTPPELLTAAQNPEPSVPHLFPTAFLPYNCHLWLSF